MFWQVSSFPLSEYHIFLSHCAEDRAWVVHPVYEELKRRGIIPWLDREDYYYGRDSRTALRDGLLRSRHVVFFITLGMLKYTRGWCAMELAYSNLLQVNFNFPGGNLLNFELALFFLDRADPELPKTVWQALRDRGQFYHPSDGDPVKWTYHQISRFLKDEQKLSLDMSRVIVPGSRLFTDLSARGGLIERISQVSPSPIP